MVFHFTVDSAYHIKRVYTTPDSSLLNGYSRALMTVNILLNKMKDTVNLAMNQYVRKNGDTSYTVWCFPGVQRDNTVAYGGEFIYTLDRTGNYITSDSSYFQGFHSFRLDASDEIWLDYSDQEKYTLGELFFAWYYKANYPRIILENKTSKSTILQDKEKGYYWAHAMNDSKK